MLDPNKLGRAAWQASQQITSSRDWEDLDLLTRQYWITIAIAVSNQVIPEINAERLFYDVWIRGRWSGMAIGTPQEARKMCEEGYPEVDQTTVVLTPFHGKGTSHATYAALIGKTAVGAHIAKESQNAEQSN